MDEFSYLSVLLSIIIGLALAQILQGIRGRILSRAQVVSFWPTQAWAAMLLLVSAQTWWAMFGFRTRHEWSFLQFLILLLQTIVLYLASGLVYPDFPAGEAVNLKEHYFAHRRAFFGLLALNVLVSVVRDPIFDGHLTDPANLTFHALFFAMGIFACFIANVLYHKIMAVIAALLFVSYITLLFLRLH